MDFLNFNLKITDLLFLIRHQTENSYSEYDSQSIGPKVDEHGFDYQIESKWFCQDTDRSIKLGLVWNQLEFVRVCNEIYALESSYQDITIEDDMYITYNTLLNDHNIEKEVYRNNIISLTS
tara:strand:- start:50 stop:412 length:363 start_codon:yes stop_codon:yes gene_type:complete